MQTFLPSADFRTSAQMLDWRRLGKQRSEVKQIYNAIVLQSGWKHHTAVKMWENNVDALLHYGMTCCVVWCERGYEDNLWNEFFMNLEIPYCDDQSQLPLPKWLGSPKLHASHRSNLLRKDYSFYSKKGWTEPSTLPYFWPTPDYDWRKYEAFHVGSH